MISSYVGMFIVGRAEQDWKAPSAIDTREVGRTTLTRLELSTTTMIIRYDGEIRNTYVHHIPLITVLHMYMTSTKLGQVAAYNRRQLLRGE